VYNGIASAKRLTPHRRNQMTCEICGSTENVENVTFNGPENETEYFAICADCNETEE